MSKIAAGHVWLKSEFENYEYLFLNTNFLLNLNFKDFKC